MGGRGSWSPDFPIAPSSGKVEWTEFPGRWSPGTLGEALGAKGKPKAIRDAYAGANPYYDAKQPDFSMNCQRAVIAYELRRRGYDVIASPTYEGDLLPRSAHAKSDGTRTGYWMGAFRGAKPVSVAASRNSTVRKNIESQMREYGSGSRAVIAVQWQGTTSGHVFNVENVGGKIRYVDAQTGKRVNIRQYLSISRPGETQLIRTDNLKVSERAKKSVVPRRG